MRTWLVIVVLAACEKAQHAPPAAGSGSASDALVDGFVANMEAYGAKATPILLAFDGDCAALSDKMLALEPLAQQIRARGAELEADPARKRAAQERIQAMRAQVLARYAAAIAPATMADVEKKEDDVHAKCHGDARYEAAMQRVGLMKRKKQP